MPYGTPFALVIRVAMWFFSTLYDAIAPLESDLEVPIPAGSDPHTAAQQQWQATLLALTQLLRTTLGCQVSSPLSPKGTKGGAEDRPPSGPTQTLQGVVLSGRTPVISDPLLLAQLHTGVFAPQGSPSSTGFLLPSQGSRVPPQQELPSAHVIPLLADDPLATEQFCLGVSQQFCWIAGLTTVAQAPFLYLSFSPDTVQQAWQMLRSRVQLTQPQHRQALDRLMAQFPFQAPDYRIPAQFSRLLLAQVREPLAVPVASGSLGGTASPSSPPETPPQPESAFDPFDVELVKAIAHEVCTPLTTIHTLTRLLLKRSDLPSDVLKRLASIQRECSDQMDRFGLIFRAMELTSPLDPPLMTPLVALPLHQVLRENIARWQQQASRRNLTLNVQLPHQLPAVLVRDPAMLDQVLTGLINRLSQGLPSGSQMNLMVALAGHQLKLQLESCLAKSEEATAPSPEPMFQALGDLLMLQPETGGVSLSLPVTKQLFQTLGGKLRVKHQQHREVLTIFLPLRTESLS